jgi:hypothetical protein
MNQRTVRNASFLGPALATLLAQPAWLVTPAVVDRFAGDGR